MERNEPVLHVHTRAHFEGGADQHANLSCADFGKQFLLADFRVGFMDKRDLLARNAFRHQLIPNVIIDRKGRIVSVIVPVEHIQHLGEEQRDIVNKSGHLISLS